MEIKTIDDIIEKHQLSKETLKGIETRLCKMADMKQFSFTALQIKAFNTEGFWRGNLDEEARHVVIQGATSSGKTLISEMAILDCLKSRKKSIVLVPLKAMVRERCEYFQRDFKPLGTRQIYASSSDFQDHDGDIINGDYEVAVIVYEKFFAMLSQSSNSMLNNCALLVVDELQMLSSVNRGPKLEIGIQKVIRNNSNPEKNTVNTRIMCLTTCDCKVTHVIEWLTVEDYRERRTPILIESPDRPVGLKEYVIEMDGSWKMRYIRGEHDYEKVKDEDSGKIEVLGFDAENKTDQSKKLLLKALLQKIYLENPKAKVLIFVNGRRRTYDIAAYIARQDILPYESISEEMKQINEYEGDEYQNVLKETLLPRKIAFHNASLSVALREFIEDIFEKENQLRLVVATETLTIGMNMPVDVMILFDSEVHRGNSGLAEKLTSQEYKNFAGRAGRLGGTNHIGESYIFASTNTNAAQYWDNYINCRTEEIMSALADTGEKAQAPYYLSLMDKSRYEIEDLNKFWEESFVKKCNGKPIDMKNVAEELVKANLCQICRKSDEDEDEESDEEKRYELSDYGVRMAPYAFNLRTCKKIRRFFFNGGLKKVNSKWQEKPEEGKGGVPGDISEEDIQNDKYLLDILYMLCCTEEIKNLSQLKLPSADKNPDKSRQALNKIENELRKFIAPQNSEKAICHVWPESPLMYMLNNGYEHEVEDKQCVMRAILLWYWTKGEPIPEIKRKTGFDSFVSIVSGDIARMAEAVSYQIEAIYHCYGGYSGRTNFKYKILKPLYALSTRIHYGMPRNLVIIANQHIHGLDRKTILKIGEAAKKSGKYDSPANFLKEASSEELEGIITEQKRNLLLQKIDELYMRDNLNILLDNIQNNPQSKQISDEEYQAIKELYEVGSESENENLLAPLAYIFCTDDYLVQNFENIGKRFYNSNTRVRFVAENAVVKLGNMEFAIGYYTGKQKKDAILEKFYSQKECNKNILLVKDESILGNIQASGKGNELEIKGDNQQVICHIHLVMTFKIFSELIAQDIALGDSSAILLEAMLKDTYGVFYSCGLQVLYSFLQNYDSNSNQHLKKGISDSSTLRILCDKRQGQDNQMCKNIFDELSQNEIPFRVLRWGDELRKEQPSDAPTMLFLTWDAVKSSKSLYEFCSQLRQNRYQNTYAIFESEESFLKWGTDNSELACHELQHCTKIEGLEMIAQQAKNVIACFKRNQFLLGVSYAHEEESYGERSDVIQLCEIVDKINNVLGESSVLFDRNPSCKNRFNGNAALPETLELYKQCEYFIILDDRYYDYSNNCKQEAQTIKERLNQGIEPNHLWFLHPDNDKHCSLFSENDYSTRLKLTEENTNDIVNGIIEIINRDMNIK